MPLRLLRPMIVLRHVVAVIFGLALTGLSTMPASAQPLIATSSTLPDVCADPMQTSCTRGVLYVLDGESLQIDRAMDLWRGLPSAVAQKTVVHPAGTHAYVDVASLPGTSRSIVVIDLRTGTRVTSFAVSGGLRTISNDGALLYMATSTAVVAIDSATGTIVSTVPITAPADVAVARNSNRIYVAGGISPAFFVAVLDAANGTLIQNIPVTQWVNSVKLTPDETHLYAVAPTSRIFDIDTATNVIAGTIADFGGPSSPNSVTFARGRAYVAVSTLGPGGGTGVIAVIDIATRALVATISAVDPIFAEATTDELRVWTANLGEPRAIAIDTAVNQTLGHVEIPGGPGVFAAIPTERTTALVVEQPVSSSVVAQPFTLSGWAVDVMGLLAGPGVSTVHVWAFPAGGGTPTFVGADYGRPRPDIGALFGATFTNSGYDVTVRGLVPGPYELRAFGFSTRTGGFSLFGSVAVTIVSGARLVVETPATGALVTPPFDLSGYALDTDATGGTGIDAIHVWAYPTTGGAPTFAGAATMGDARPDIGALFGAQFINAGYHLTVATLPPGTYTLVVYGLSTVTGAFNIQRQIGVTVPAPTPLMYVDAPAANAELGPSFRIAGWAVELNAASGTGVDLIHVWATSPSGAATFLGAPTYGVSRPDVGAWLGARYAPSGFVLDAVLPPGAYTLSVYARSTTTGTFRTVRAVPVTIVSGARLVVDTPASGTLVTPPFVLSGYALDTGATTGTGIDAIHVWAYPVSGAPTFAGAATIGDARPDVGVLFGAQFANAGYHLTIPTLPPGAYTLVVYGLSTATGRFSVEQHIGVTITAPDALNVSLMAGTR